MPYHVLLPRTPLITPKWRGSTRASRTTDIFAASSRYHHTFLAFKQPGGRRIMILISNFLLPDEQNTPRIGVNKTCHLGNIFQKQLRTKMRCRT